MKPKFHLYFLLTLFFYIPFLEYAQNLNNTERLELSLKKENRHQNSEFNTKNSQSIKDNDSSKDVDEKYTIPVIFHFLNTGKLNNEPNSKENLACKTQSILSIVNAFFTDTIENTSFDFPFPYDTKVLASVDERFQEIKGKINIEFVAATKDPNGNTLEIPGVDQLVDIGISNSLSPIREFYEWSGKNNKYYIDVFISDALITANNFRISSFSVSPLDNTPPFIAIDIGALGGFDCNSSDGSLPDQFIHELGHYLGLKNTYSIDCDPINDGIADTPITMIGDDCKPNTLNACDVYPNYENFMSTSNCRKMFTKGQVDAMEYWLNQEKSETNLYPRKALWQSENLIATGVKPSDLIVNFKSVFTICEGEKVQFYDNSLGKPIAWQWEFESGTPSTSTERNPIITYDNSGIYNVKLTVSNALGRKHSITKENYIRVNQTGLTTHLEVEKFDKQFPSSGWKIINPDNSYTWHQRKDVGRGDNFCLAINNSNTFLETDYIQTPYYNFSNSFRSQMYFDIAYTKYDDFSDDMLKIQVTIDCGATWEDIYSKTHTELETTEVPTNQSISWTPTKNYHWRKESIDLSKYDGESSIAFRLKNISGFGTKIMIDNFKIALRNNNRPVAKIVTKQIDQNICNNDVVTVAYRDESTGIDTSTMWYFEGGTPETSKNKNETVTYTSPGSYNVSLISKNKYGEDQKTLKDIVKISAPIRSGYTQDFSQEFPPIGWEIDNPDQRFTWERQTDIGNGDTYSMSIKNRANHRGSVDEIILSSFDMTSQNRNITSFSFDVAYTKFGDSNNDTLKVLGSTDCGITWETLYEKNHFELETVDIPIEISREWIPSETSHWRTENISLERYADISSDLLIKFVNISGLGTQIWIDNIKTLSGDENTPIKSNTIGSNQITISPNPFKNSFTIHLEKIDHKTSGTIDVLDISGKLILQKQFSNATQALKLGEELKEPGVYFVKIRSTQFTQCLKIIKQ